MQDILQHIGSYFDQKISLGFFLGFFLVYVTLAPMATKVLDAIFSAKGSPLMPMTPEAIVRIEVADAAIALGAPIGRHEVRIGDLEKAVLELASAIEGLAWNRQDHIQLKGEILRMVDTARALATPSTHEDFDGDDEPEPPTPMLRPRKRYFIDLVGGGGTAVDTLEEAHYLWSQRFPSSDVSAYNVWDQKQKKFLAWHGAWDDGETAPTEAAA